MFLAKIARILGTRQKRAACEENRRFWWQQQIEALFLLLGTEENEVAFKDSVYSAHIGRRKQWFQNDPVWLWSV